MYHSVPSFISQTAGRLESKHIFRLNGYSPATRRKLVEENYPHNSLLFKAPPYFDPPSSMGDQSQDPYYKERVAQFERLQMTAV